MSKADIPWGFIFRLLAILLSILLLFAIFTFVLFCFFPWPRSAADFGQAISGISALFTALAFAGALYTVFLQRKALELQQQQMTKQISEVREQTKLIADRFQQIVPIGRAYDRMEATEAITDAVLAGAKKGINEAIFYLPDTDFKRMLEEALETFQEASEKYLEAGARMEELAIARLLARGGRVKARLKWTNKREEIAAQLGEWATGIRAAQAELEKSP
jgi:hypothetical protein